MLELLLGGAAITYLLARKERARRNGRVIELETTLPAVEVDQVIHAIRSAIPQTAPQLDAMAASYRERNLPLTAYELARRAWEVRGGQDVPPEKPYAGTPLPPGAPGSHVPMHTDGPPPVGCLDAAADPAMCQAVTSALLTETNADKLHAFAETLRSTFPEASGALDAKARLLGWVGPLPPRTNGAPPAPATMSAPPQNAPPPPGHVEPTPISWTAVLPDQSNVPPEYYGQLVSVMQQLSRDETMPPGTERSVTVGDRVFVFTKPVPSAGVPYGTVWITRMQTGTGTSSASTGYGSGPLWPSDIMDSRSVPVDRRFMGSPTIYDPSTEILSPPDVVQTVLMGGADPAHFAAGAPPEQSHFATGGSPEHPPFVGVDAMAMAAAVAAMPPEAGLGQGIPGIMGASRPDIVNGPPAAMAQVGGVLDPAMEAAAMQAAAEQEMAARQAHEAAMVQAHTEAAMAQAHHDAVMAEAHADHVDESLAVAAAAQAPVMDARLPGRPRPNYYVYLRRTDSVFPVKLAKIGSGSRSNANSYGYDQLTMMNPHLVSPEGAWRRLVPGDEVCVPPEWARNLQERGFLVKKDEGA